MRKIILCFAAVSLMLCSCGEYGEAGDNQDVQMSSGDMHAAAEPSVQEDLESGAGSLQAGPEPEQAMEPPLSQRESPISAVSAFQAVLLNEMAFTFTGKYPSCYIGADMPWEGLLRDQPFGPPEGRDATCTVRKAKPCAGFFFESAAGESGA